MKLKRLIDFHTVDFHTGISAFNKYDFNSTLKINRTHEIFIYGFYDNNSRIMATSYLNLFGKIKINMHKNYIRIIYTPL